MITKEDNLVGKRFNSFICIKFSHSKEYEYNKNGNKYTTYIKYYVFKCDCGVEKTLNRNSVVSGRTGACKFCNRKKNYLFGLTKPKQNYHINRIYASYKVRANSKKLDFKLSKEEFKEFIFESCYYCKAPPSNKRKACSVHIKPFIYSGIDRLNNKVGYVKGNCVPCCHKCNRMKSDLSFDDFLKHIKLILHYDNKN